MGEDGKEEELEVDGDVETRVLWLQFLCLRVCCCCWRLLVETLSLLKEQSTASN